MYSNSLYVRSNHNFKSNPNSNPNLISMAFTDFVMADIKSFSSDSCRGLASVSGRLLRSDGERGDLRGERGDLGEEQGEIEGEP
jgi:hypothetical protein